MSTLCAGKTNKRRWKRQSRTPASSLHPPNRTRRSFEKGGMSFLRSASQPFVGLLALGVTLEAIGQSALQLVAALEHLAGAM